jgi:hypothetical protein
MVRLVAFPSHCGCLTDLLVIGTGGESIYGEKFEDEAFPLKHTIPFLLSMVRRNNYAAVHQHSHTSLSESDTLRPTLARIPTAPNSSSHVPPRLTLTRSTSSLVKSSAANHSVRRWLTFPLSHTWLTIPHPPTMLQSAASRTSPRPPATFPPSPSPSPTPANSHRPTRRSPRPQSQSTATPTKITQRTTTRTTRRTPP